jgi:ABC-type glutathione transport system ATPase component
MATVPHSTSAAAEVVFHVQSVSKTCQTGDVTVTVLRDVSLDLAAGEFIVILGPARSGKSTLLNIMGGLDTPTTSRRLRHRPSWRGNKRRRESQRIQAPAAAKMIEPMPGYSSGIFALRPHTY